MEYKQFIIELIDKAAWPIVVFVIVCVFRKPLIQKLKSLREIRYGKMVLEFGKELASIEAELKKCVLYPQVKMREEDVEYYAEMSRISPKAVIIESWVRLEVAMKKMQIAHNQDFAIPETYNEFMKMMRQDGFDDICGYDLISPIKNLRFLRDMAVWREDIDWSKYHDHSLLYAKLATQHTMLFGLAAQKLKN